LAAAGIYRQLLMETLGNKEDIGQVYLNYGLVMEATNQPAKAAALYQHLWFHHPTADTIPQTKERMVVLEEKYHWGLPLQKEKFLWHQIKALQRERKYEQALEAIENFLKKFPQSKLLPKIYLTRGKNYLKSGQRRRAVPSFKQVFKNYPQSRQAPTALYYSGKACWNLGNDKRAIRELILLLNKYPHTKWADEALYLLGRIHEGNKSYSRALKTYQRLVRSYPRSVWADKGIWRLGWIHYRLGKYQLATIAFTPAIKKPAQSPWREASLYWQGRSLEHMGQIKKAVGNYQELLQTARYTYYAQLAQERLPRLSKNSPDFGFPRGVKPLDWKPFPLPAKTSKLRFRLERVQELLALGLAEDLRPELDLLAKSPNRQLDFWVYLSHAYQLSGDYKKSIQVLWRYLELKAWGAQQLPPEAWPLFYPRFFREELERQGRQQQLDPYLLAAMIRRESVFDPQAKSLAGALGLMQIIPGTASKIARQLGEQGFQQEQLYNPSLNLRYGSFYFAQLRKRFQGKIFLALAAYNAGEKNARRWWRAKETEEWEEFVENIPFSETRHYIRQVISNYNNYLLLYRASE